jgi:hypothetical protein
LFVYGKQLFGQAINQRVNIIRTDFDRLKAAPTNCVRQGPESQNRDANPAKGQRLRVLFDKIQRE